MDIIKMYTNYKTMSVHCTNTQKSKKIWNENNNVNYKKKLDEILFIIVIIISFWIANNPKIRQKKDSDCQRPVNLNDS